MTKIEGDRALLYLLTLEGEVDKMVYALYGLTPEEIAIVEDIKCLIRNLP